MIYKPSDDTYLLASVIKNVKKEIAIDVGTGSGYIAFILAKNCKLVIASDIDINAIKYVSKIKKEKKIYNLDLVVCNLLDSFKNKTFDLITFNPPYLPPDNFQINSQTIYINYKGENIIINFIKEIKEKIKINGECYLVLSTLSNLKEIYGLMKKNKLKFKEIINKRFFFEKIFVLQIS